MSVWATTTDAGTHWPDAGQLAAGALEVLLAVAQEQLEPYAPTIGEIDEVPTRYMLACVLQARELWAASTRDGDVIGVGDGYALRSRPLTGAVKALLRPQSGVPRLG